MTKKMRIGGACLNQIPMDWSGNLANIKEAITQARNAGIEILCLPELCITGYGCEDMFLSKWVPEKALSKVAEMMPFTQNIAVTLGLPIYLDERIYNCTCFIENTRIVGFYAKQKLANDGVHYEPRWFTSWESGKVIDFDFFGTSIPFGHITVSFNDLKIGFEICEDAWREDRPACHLVNEDVDLILNPSASHFAFGKAEFRENLVVKSSETFNCVYLYANLLGNEAGKMIYDGDILIAQRGELQAKNSRLSFHNFKILGCEIDFNDPAGSEVNLQPDVQGRMQEFSKAAGLALFDYLRKSHNQGFVLSLSGGADSSALAVLVAEAVKSGVEELGFDAFKKKLSVDLKNHDLKSIVNQLLYTAYQGTVNSSEETYLSARELADSVGATFYNWRIDEEISAYQLSIEQAIGRSLDWEKDDITLQNIQARARSPIIWMLANIKRCLLLCTSNRSEGSVGYATMDGDTSGSISPIAGVDKPFILQWLRFAENELGYTGLQRVNSLSPSAELRPQELVQTDEDDLMPYIALVAIETEAIRNRKSPAEVFNLLKHKWPDHALLKLWIIKFFKLWTRNQWKRERFAPGFHLDDFNVDPRSWFRFPILSGGFDEELRELEKMN